MRPGQFGLADALASRRGARNLILLGDPLQLPQVNQANHPAAADVAPWGHVLLDEVTLPADRGVFIEEIPPHAPRHLPVHLRSDLRGPTGLARRLRETRPQQRAPGCGGYTRIMRATHPICGGGANYRRPNRQTRRDTVDGLSGVVRPLTVTDLMVVAPITTRSAPSGRCSQKSPHGRGARSEPWTSSRAAPPRSSFLHRHLDRHRHRPRRGIPASPRATPTSRSAARCLAYLVCTEGLFNTCARSVDEMRPIATLNAFVEWAV